MGTPPFAVPALDALVAADHDVVAVYTRAPQPAGRGKTLAKSAVQVRAEALGIAVYTPPTLRDADAQAVFAGIGADIAIVAAYGLLLPQAVLDATALGCVNIHASLLPRWRGAAPIQRAILAGDAETGVTIMAMEAGLDTGPMIAVRATPIADKTAGVLTGELASIGAELLIIALQAPLAGTPQPGQGVTVAPKISKAEARLDFAQDAERLERAVRAFNPAPGAWTVIGGERLKILAAEVVPGDFAPGVIADDRLTFGTGRGALRATWVQRAGKPAMAAADLCNGWALPAGTRVDSE